MSTKTTCFDGSGFELARKDEKSDDHQPILSDLNSCNLARVYYYSAWADYTIVQINVSKDLKGIGNYTMKIDN